MMATWEQEPTMPETTGKEAEDMKVKEKARRKCTVCGNEFEGDPRTSLPVCPECQQAPAHPKGVPL